MSIFDKQSKKLTKQEIDLLEKREHMIQEMREKYGDRFCGIAWADPNDPFCTEGHVMFKLVSTEPSGIVLAPWRKTNYL